MTATDLRLFATAKILAVSLIVTSAALVVLDVLAIVL